MAYKRDAAYYKRRLKKEHPRIYADLLAGKYKSVRKASAAAGIVTLPGPLQGLKRHWRKATSADKRAFLNWVRASLPSKGAKSTLRPIVTSSGKLHPDAVAFLRERTSRRGVTPGQIMKRLGFSNFDYRLSYALKRYAPIQPEIVDKLEPWMRAEGYR